MNPDLPLRSSSKQLPRYRALGWAVLTIVGVMHAAPARADIWGYLDAQGMPHFASTQVDERYELFLRENNAPEPFKTIPVAKSASLPAEPANEVVVVAPARLLVYFEELPGHKAVQHLLHEASTKHGIDYALLQALIATESGFNSRAVSPKGAVGLMQLIPPTAERYGVKAGKNSPIEKKLTDPVVNIRAGARYLSDLIAMFPGQLELALAAYNAGEGAVQRAGNKIPNYPETKNYVKTVMQLYNRLKPTVSTVATTRVAPPGRVRVEMNGGSAGRGNMVPPNLPLAASQSRPGQD